VLEKLDRFIANFLGGIIVFLVGLTTLQVVMRYVFDSPLTWAEEFIGVVMIYFGMIGGAWGVKHGIHIALEVFVKKFLRFAERWVDWFEFSITAFMGVFELVYGVKIVSLTRYQILPATGIVVAYSYAAIPIAGFLMIVFSIGRLVEALRRER